MELYRDPTMEAAQRLEIREKGCAVCARRLALSDEALRCSTGKTFPSCRGVTKGFVLDVEIRAEAA